VRQPCWRRERGAGADAAASLQSRTQICSSRKLQNMRMMSKHFLQFRNMHAELLGSRCINTSYELQFRKLLQ
jgi:hypothetical protein